MSLAQGTRLGRFEVSSLLGVGGIGEVYAARDTQLERPVALKVLREDLARDEGHALRFFQEAKAAANLSHPNISHVYEIGEANGVTFIAMEYVEGLTLRQRLNAGRIDPEEAIDIATQIAAALAEAHATGIVHRDIKPENVMLRCQDQTVKVLDFGIAKITQKHFGPHAEASELSTVVRTGPNMILGTVNYMSPEQARGQEVDERTDIFSLGVVLYEMVSGNKPFDGPSRSDVIAELLRKTPRAIEGIPEGLDWTLSKALAKNPDERYQHAREMLADFKRLKSVFETTETSPKLSNANNSAQSLIGHTLVTQSRTRETVSSSEHLRPDVKRNQSRVWLAGGLVLVAITGLGFGSLRWASPIFASLKSFFHGSKAGPRQPMIAALTNNGKARGAAVSPDGKYVAYVMTDAGGQSIRVKHLATLSETEIVPASTNSEISGINFSPDGSYVYYVKSDGKTGTLYQVPMLGGAPRSLLQGVGFGPVGLSQDGNRIAFVRLNAQKGEYALAVADMETRREEVLLTRQAPNYISYPTWSPDGKAIVFADAHFDPKQFHWNLAEIRIGDRVVRNLSEKRWWWIGGIAWLSAKDGLVIVAREIDSPVIPIWRVSYPSGEATRLTNDTNQYWGVSLAPAVQKIVVARTEIRANISIQPVNPNAVPVQITSGREDGSIGLSWTPDGRIVFSTRGARLGETWMIGADGNGTKLLANVGAHQLSVSPDGKHIVFDSIRSGGFNIWKMGIDGSNPQPITDGAADFDPVISPDGKWVIYVSGTMDQAKIRKISLDGSDGQQLTHQHSHAPTVSPDGKLLAFYYGAPDATAKFKIGIMPLAGGEILRSFDVPEDTSPDHLEWVPDGRSIAYVRTIGGVSNIWTQPLTGGRPTQITKYSSDEIFYFAWSRDGRQLALARGGIGTDIFLISDFN